MATDQDFTFPTFSYAVDSPPLWSSSPATSPICAKTSSKNAEEELVEELKDCIEIQKEIENYFSTRKSFSWIERGPFSTTKAEEDEDEDDDDDNMDMLWEDFNEELSIETRQQTTRGNNDRNSYDDDKVINMGCVQLVQPPLRLSKNGQKAVLVSTRKHQHTNNGFLMFIKVFKKLFLLHANSNSHSRPGRSLVFNQKNHCSKDLSC